MDQVYRVYKGGLHISYTVVIISDVMGIVQRKALFNSFSSYIYHVL
jgi:hypothetical protein